MLNDPVDPREPKELPPTDNPHAGGIVIPKVVPSLPRENPYVRSLPGRTALSWLGQGWRDLWANSLPSLLYGLGVFCLSAWIAWLLFHLELDYVLFPALAGFLVLGPLVANGLYEKSRRLELGERTSFLQMIFVRPASGYQALFMGVLLLGLFLLWLRAAVIIYALFFGVVGFPGIEDLGQMLLFTHKGWGLLIAGSAVGALFAAFGFAISVFALPMMLEERTDALTALGISMAMTWNNLRVMIVWGAIVLVLFAICVASLFIGLIVIFPLLGHATWHAYRTIRGTSHAGKPSERMFIRPA
ncbi:DUF2189 domain-containing protein [Paracoccus suum]|uniref:DUF2189 domain-containing protein n=1 Tax=Paracoccus suum TaxID=2259340 RepID=A0A344PME7_9RHOB|nr:DUF2189 domain-containing protein [Paracoccus suum]AXC50552.1 DUF2189 domain-containing protein [Paracoccus suum]